MTEQVERRPPGPRWGKMIFRLAASAAVLALVLYVVGPEQVARAISAVRLGPWLVGLCAFIGLHLLSALKWRFFLSLSGVSLPVTRAFQCYAAGLFANLCLPSLVGGDFVRAALAVRATHQRMEAVVLGSVVDRLSDILALGLLVGMAMVAAPSAAEALHGGAIRGVVVLAVLLALALIGLIVVRMVLPRLPLRRLPRKLARVVIRGLRALSKLFARPALGTAGLTFCLLLQAGFVLVNIYLGTSMGLELDPRLWFLLWPLAKIAAMLPVSLGGLGVREAAFGLLVEPFADSHLAIAESLVWQSILIAGGLAAGVVWLASGLRVTPQNHDRPR